MMHKSIDALTLRDIYTADVITISAEMPINVALQLMQKKSISALIIVDKLRPIGIFTERDAVRITAQRKHTAGISVSEFMSTPLITARLDADFRESYQLMNSKGLRHLIVVDAEGLLKGIVSEADFLNHLGMEYLVDLKTVASVMSQNVLTISQDTLLGEAVDIMATRQISCVVVAEADKCLGIVTERDVVIYAQEQKNIDKTKIEPVMSQPARVIRQSASIQEAILQMNEAKIRRLVVVNEENKIAGLITRHDIVKSLEDNYIAFLHETISRQKQELESARTSLSVVQEHQLFLEIIDQVHDSIIIAEADTGRILDVNKEACNQLKCSKPELLKKRIYDFCRLAGDVQVWKKLAESFRNDHNKVVETEYKLLNGDTLPVEISIRYYEKIGKKMLIFTARDITERKLSEIEHARLRKQLLQAQKMEAIGQLTGGVAHDFNNILAAILGYNGLALSRYSNVSPPKLIEYLNEVKLAGERGRDLVAQMLLFSRGGETEAKPLLLPPIVKEAVKMMRSSLPTSISIDTHIDQVLPAVLIDPVQLHQVLMNLFINSRDAMDGQGRLTILLNWAKGVVGECSSCHKPVYGDWVSLTVTDNGQGIESTQLEKIFAPFYTTKEAGKGTGMGLSVLHGILHKHSAHVLVQSIEGSGTSFQLLFPAIKADPENKNLLHSSETFLEVNSSGNILLVDDEVSVAGFIEEVLLSQGFQVQKYHNPIEALERYTLSPSDFDLLITDQTMPEMNGLELIKFCRDLNPNLPIIMCTGFSEDIDEKKAKLMGINHFFYKPVDANQFLKAVDELVEKNS